MKNKIIFIIIILIILSLIFICIKNNKNVNEPDEYIEQPDLITEENFIEIEEFFPVE